MPPIHRRTFAAVVLAGLLLAPAGFATSATAAGSPTYLYANRSTGWGFSNTSLTSPGPNLEVEVVEHVTLNLTSLDGRNHNWFIDYNDNSVVDANESYSDSGTFRGTLQYNLRLETRPARSSTDLGSTEMGTSGATSRSAPPDSSEASWAIPS